MTGLCCQAPGKAWLVSSDWCTVRPIYLRCMHRKIHSANQYVYADSDQDACTPGCSAALKTVLLHCRLMLANKAVRFFVAVYAVLLHLFVFGVVYYSVWSEGSISASTGLN